MKKSCLNNSVQNCSYEIERHMNKCQYVYKYANLFKFNKFENIAIFFTQYKYKFNFKLDLSW